MKMELLVVVEVVVDRVMVVLDTTFIISTLLVCIAYDRHNSNSIIVVNCIVG